MSDERSLYEMAEDAYEQVAGNVSTRGIAAAVDAVEAKVRADEQERALEFCCRDNAADLRAKVRDLPTTRTRAWGKGWDSVSLDDVLALLPEVL